MQRIVGALMMLAVLAACQVPSRPVMMPADRNAALASTYGLPEDSRAKAQQVFKKMDKNGDNYLSQAEYLAAQMADYHEADAASVQQYLVTQFTKFDRNKDKRLSFTEYLGS